MRTDSVRFEVKTINYSWGVLIIDYQVPWGTNLSFGKVKIYVHWVYLLKLRLRCRASPKESIIETTAAGTSAQRTGQLDDAAREQLATSLD